MKTHKRLGVFLQKCKEKGIIEFSLKEYNKELWKK